MSSAGQWLRQKSKRRRNSGRKYFSLHSKTEQAAKKLGQLCACPKKCADKIQGNAENIFHAFWDLGDHHKQNTYLIGCIKMFPKKRCYVEENKDKRNFSFKYAIKVNGIETEVCRNSFLAVHGLQNNRGRLENLKKQLKIGHEQARPDQRG